MDYYQKYIKYKSKYLNLKYGGAVSTGIINKCIKKKD